MSLAYLDHLMGLLPVGPAWPREIGTLIEATLKAPAGELQRIDDRASNLINEADVDTITELLVEWEDDCGLPDQCSGYLESFDARRRAVGAQVRARGGQSKGYFVELAATYGIEITIDEFRPFRCTGNCNQLLNTDPWIFTWRVNAHSWEEAFMVCSGVCTDAIHSWNNKLLECIIRRRSPAHTLVIFAYHDKLATEDGVLLTTEDGVELMVEDNP